MTKQIGVVTILEEKIVDLEAERAKALEERDKIV